MKRLALAMFMILVGCSPWAEFPPETVQAYQSDNNLRAATLQKCGEHATNRTPFATQSDTEECQKAAIAQGNVNFATRLQHEHEGNERATQEIDQLAGGNSSGKH